MFISADQFQSDMRERESEEGEIRRGREKERERKYMYDVYAIYPFGRMNGDSG